MAALYHAANQISALRASAGGGAETTIAGNTIVAADSNSIAYDRTTDQVLHIVYLSATAGVIKKGGFFPNGLNGTSLQRLPRRCTMES